MNPAPFPAIFALVWRASSTDETFDPATFDERVPRLMAWLRELRAAGHLVGCGGGGFRDRSGGLTLIRAADADEATRLSAGSPMNEIGSTEILQWDVFFADLQVLERASRLA